MICSEGVKVYQTDSQGSWGIENDKWCGIPDGEAYCWSKLLGYECCTKDNGPRSIIDSDGEWGFENNNWCGYRNSTSRWNDREKFDSTRDEWNEFKIKWDEEYKDNYERLSVFAGEDESMLNFGWYSTTDYEPVIRFSTNQDMSNSVDFIGTNKYYKELKGIKYYSNKVTVTDLKRKSSYYYQRKLNNQWEDPIQFNTYDPDNFNFIFVGDPQIGGSTNRISALNKVVDVEEAIRNDAFNWNMTITSSFELTREPSLFLSAGDQTDTDLSSLYYSPFYESKEEETRDICRQESEYSALLLPKLIKTIPMAAAVGNHDSYTPNYRNHFNTPNSYTTPEYTDIIPGYSYFFKYNNVLVVVLETNFGTCTDYKNVISNATKKYPNTDWRIAMFHHDLYGNGQYHSQDNYIKNELRPCLTKLIDKNKFDLVINGHDHVYTATHFVSYDNENENGYSVSNIQKGIINKNYNGTLYITANCSTGSKLYGFRSENFDYVYYYNQTFTSTFGVLDFKKENGKAKLSITSYEVDTHNITDRPYIFEKKAYNEEECWSLKLQPAYPCCYMRNKEVVSIDSNGKWSTEHGTWCGIIEEQEEENKNTTTTTITTTSLIPTTTTTKTTITKTTTTKTTTTKTTTTTTTTTTTPEPTICGKIYEQCGGFYFSGPNCCEEGSRCIYQNDYYSQCLPTSFFYYN
ncbi:Metallo-dependent phosphatase [Anaeromyces robustus]|uniref:Purple acid phosphatase n=1 Tax=Anaeromyces robustus TaxID=1754192 RepID=A0A1Y1XK63_9FUNG|nr:Metallo-dependent phosphatase [Anaeromyces robustus]|eukprot:ORX85734.1 Metallo-dependent phosphatase [Anaeromyces robustus]